MDTAASSSDQERRLEASRQHLGYHGELEKGQEQMKSDSELVKTLAVFELCRAQSVPTGPLLESAATEAERAIRTRKLTPERIAAIKAQVRKDARNEVEGIRLRSSGFGGNWRVTA